MSEINLRKSVTKKLNSIFFIDRFTSSHCSSSVQTHRETGKLMKVLVKISNMEIKTLTEGNLHDLYSCLWRSHFTVPEEKKQTETECRRTSLRVCRLIFKSGGVSVS